jgi:hypothetical protein
MLETVPPPFDVKQARLSQCFELLLDVAFGIVDDLREFSSSCARIWMGNEVQEDL